MDHLAPIWRALPDEYRGRFYARGRAYAHAHELGIEATPSVPRTDSIVVVASYEDYRATGRASVVMVNHGVGQTYTGDARSADNPSYSGGRNRERVVLYLCPSHRDAQVNRRAYPGARSIVIGVPKLDPYHPAVPHEGPSDTPVIALSFHADVHVCPETRWAFSHYKDAIVDFVRSTEYAVIGHAHPRMHAYMRKFWERIKVPFEPDFNKVLDHTSLYVCDNSSTIYEFASTGRPVVVLNAPWYRRNIHHGLRFWSDIPGIQVDEPNQLVPAVEKGLCDSFYWKYVREQVTDRVYGLDLCDGNATQRSVDALIGLCHAYPHEQARSQAPSTR